MSEQIIKAGKNDAELKLSPEIREILSETSSKLRGYERRIFMARVVNALGKGGQRKAESELGWDRKTIRKGQGELINGPTEDSFSARGRKKAEEHKPELLEDIRSVVEPGSQADPTFRTTRLYTPLTAGEVRRRLISEKNYPENEVPCERTIRNKLNDLNYHPQKVAKTKPLKKIPETDDIFDRVHRTNKVADETGGVLRMSWDTKAGINIGPFSRGGYSRRGEKACDHDFTPDTVLKLFGIFLPACDEPFFYFTESRITADFMVDMLEELWPEIRQRFDPHTLVINLDNGTENSSRRTQFIRRLADFARQNEVSLELAYYPPYHSKYNPIERVWGRLENYWNGELLNTAEKVLGLARTMTWKGKNPTVSMIKKCYEAGVKQSKKVMAELEKMIERVSGLEKWSVFIPGYQV